jgi:hypothetical protein
VNLRRVLISVIKIAGDFLFKGLVESLDLRVF